jgi:hypothetical protein
LKTEQIIITGAINYRALHDLLRFFLFSQKLPLDFSKPGLGQGGLMFLPSSDNITGLSDSPDFDIRNG